MTFRFRLPVLGVLVAWLSLSGVVRAAQELEEASERWRWLRPNVELPAYVPAEPGKLSLFADFDHPDKDGVPLYVVNRTRKDVAIPSQDGDVYLKLERQLPDGSWERAQRHLYSDCGNSYTQRNLPPGMHVRRLGHRAAQGEQATVRYASYGGLEIGSNTSSALIDPAEVKAAREDGMSSQGFPWGLTQFADQIRLANPGGTEPFVFNSDYSSAVAGLELAAATGGLPAVRAACAKWEKVLAALPQPSDDQRSALRRLREILGQPWPEHPSLARLMQRCLTAVRNTDSGAAVFGRPEKELELVWDTLGQCRQSEAFFSRPESLKVELPDPQIWKTVTLLAAERAGKAGDKGACRVLKVAQLADEFVPDAEFNRLLASADQSLVQVAAVTLGRRQQWKSMVKLALPLPPENQYEVFGALTGVWVVDGDVGDRESRIRTRPDDDLEQVFWDRVQRQQPLKVSAILGPGAWDNNPYDRSAFGGLIVYWEKELERSAALKADFPLVAAELDRRFLIRFISGWHLSDDLPLLRASLNYRGYREETYTSSERPGQLAKRVYEVRREAAEALKRRGEQIPADLVLEVEVDVTPMPKGQ